MRCPIDILSLLFSLLLLRPGETSAQSPIAAKLKPILSAVGNKIGSSVMGVNWDSIVYYVKKMEDASKDGYGEMCLPQTILSKKNGYSPDQLDDYRSAYYYLKRGIGLFTRLNDSIIHVHPIENLYIKVIFNFGLVCRFIGANTEAQTYLSKAAVTFKRDHQTEKYAQSLLVQAGIYASKGEYAKAELLNINARETLDSAEKNPVTWYLLASCYNNLGFLFAGTGNKQKALLYLQTANKIEKKSEGCMETEDIKMLLNLAEVYVLNGHSDSAILKCQQAEYRLSGRTNALLKAEIIKVKALICLQQKKLFQAIQLLKQFRSITDTLSVIFDTYAAATISLGNCYTKTNQFKAADSLFRKEAEKLRKSGLDYSWLMQQNQMGLCANLVAEKKYAEAMDSLVDLCHLTFRAINKNFYGMSEAEKLQYKGGLDGIFNLIYGCLYRGGAPSQKVLMEICTGELQRNSLVLLGEINLMNRIRNSADTSLTSLYNTWLSDKEILSKQYSLPIDQRIYSTDSLETISETLEKKVSAWEGRDDIANSRSNLASLLPNRLPSTADIQFIRYQYTAPDETDNTAYAAFIIKDADSTPAFVRLCSEKQLTGLMKNKSGEWIDEDQLTQKLYDSRGNDADELYRLIWAPLQPYLQNVRNINYSTAGLLNNIALPAVYDGRNHLLQAFVFHRFFSLTDNAVQNAGYQSPTAISIWGNMDYDSTSKTITQSKNISISALLPFDTTEILQLKDIFNHNNTNIDSYENKEATEENFKRQASTIRDVLHISTHGFYIPFDKKNTKTSLPGSFIAGIQNPLFRCGLAFSGANYYLLKGVAPPSRDDGILTGYEVTQLDLHNVQLLTLSACETGLGDITDNEGNIGLQRAFKISGVSNMLVSLWRVPAKQSTELLALFYTEWLKGNSLSEALRNAQSTLQKKDYPPYYWAGFVLIE